MLQQFDGARSAAEVAAGPGRGRHRRVGGGGGEVRREAQGDGPARAHRGRALGAHDGAAPRPAAKRLKRGASFRGDIFRIRWSMGDPDTFMDRTMPYLRWMFTRGFLIASVVLFAVYFLVLAREVARAFRRVGAALSPPATPQASSLTFWLTGTRDHRRCTSWGTATPASTSAARCTRSARCCCTSSRHSSAT